jgi:hypothetical protein
VTLVTTYFDFTSFTFSTQQHRYLSTMETLEKKIAVTRDAINFLDRVEEYLVIICNAHKIMQLYQTTGINGVTLNKAVC